MLRNQTWALRTAALSGLLGVAFIICLGGTVHSGIGTLIAGLAMAALTLCAITGFLFSFGPEQIISISDDLRIQECVSDRHPYMDWIAGSIIFLIGALACSSWFEAGKAIAGGDVPPPNGLAWVNHLFDPWVWSGITLGGPNQLSTQLPWAGAAEIVHLLGGSASQAQQFWITTLFAGTALCTYLLLRLLRLVWWAAGIGALAFAFNPYVLSEVGFNTVFLAGMLSLTLLAIIILATGLGSISGRTGGLLLVASSPLIGYVYNNPPLILLIVAVMLSGILAAAIIDGKAAFRRLARTGIWAVPLLFLTSAYWVIPALIATGNAATASLSHTSSWTWTESRATLGNAFWLNTAWGWAYTEYFPFAPLYSLSPLIVLRYLLPAGAFAALPLALLPEKRRRRRMVLLTGFIALFALLFSTGTRFPGSAIFLPLYHLPLGWLLREPGRFLMAAALAYAVLLAYTAQRLGGLVSVSLQRRAPQHRILLQKMVVPGFAILASVPLLIPAYPLMFGQMAPDHRPGGLPPVHVRLPAYWTKMAAYVNRNAPPGETLVMPPDDFYQMPYTWGYYGSDGFITQLIGRHVLDPNGQGYDKVSQELLSTVDHVGQDLVVRDYVDSQDLLDALGVRFILVRGDVNSNFPGRHILPPTRIADGLEHLPGSLLIYRAGPLDLFELPYTPPTSLVVTDASQAPNLNILSLFPAGTRLVEGPPSAHLPSVIQLPSRSTWALHGSQLSRSVALPSGPSYRLDTVQQWSSFLTPPAVNRRLGPPPYALSHVRGNEYSVSTKLGPNLLADGDFSLGPWQKTVGDCNETSTKAYSDLFATVLPHTAPRGHAALELAARRDSACESSRIAGTSGGAMLLSLQVRHVVGAPPRICLWEANLGHCATAPPKLSVASGWHHYQDVLVPDPGATRFSVFLYADSSPSHPYTVNEYADVRVQSLTDVSAVVVGQPSVPRYTRTLRESSNGYSNYWIGPKSGTHVRVDGLRNGWWGSPAVLTSPLRFRWAGLELASDLTSLSALLASVAIGLSLAWERLCQGQSGLPIVRSAVPISDPAQPCADVPEVKEE